MKKLLAMAVTAAFTVSMLAGCGQSAETTDASAQETTQETETEAADEETADAADAASEDTAERTTFTVGFDAEFPPYGYMDESGEYTFVFIHGIHDLPCISWVFLCQILDLILCLSGNHFFIIIHSPAQGLPSDDQAVADLHHFLFVKKSSGLMDPDHGILYLESSPSTRSPDPPPPPYPCGA